jgi:hypothetical protein
VGISLRAALPPVQGRREYAVQSSHRAELLKPRSSNDDPGRQMRPTANPGRRSNDSRYIDHRQKREEFDVVNL